MRAHRTTNKKHVCTLIKKNIKFQFEFPNKLTHTVSWFCIRAAANGSTWFYKGSRRGIRNGSWSGSRRGGRSPGRGDQEGIVRNFRRRLWANECGLAGKEGIPWTFCDRVISGFSAANLRGRSGAKLSKDGKWKDRPKMCPYHRITVDAAGATAALQGDHIPLGPIPAGGLEDVHHLGAVGQGHATAIIVLGCDAVLANWITKKWVIVSLASRINCDKLEVQVFLNPLRFAFKNVVFLLTISPSF